MEKMRWSGVLCVWIMEGMMVGIVWKGYEVKGVDDTGRHLNEWITVETNCCWKGELKIPDNNSNE